MNYEMMNNNAATLCGVVMSKPVYSHQMYGEGFYESTLSVPRLSEQLDVIPFTISERLLDGSGIEEGSLVTFSGQLRSYNKMVDGKSKLLLTLFVREILENDETRYAFRWERYEMDAQINSGVIRTMEFLVDGEWKTSVPEGVTDVTARVTFTSGHVMELPAVIRPATQSGVGYAYIGYNVDVYQRTGALVDFEDCHFKQSRRISIG